MKKSALLTSTLLLLTSLFAEWSAPLVRVSAVTAQGGGEGGPTLAQYCNNELTRLVIPATFGASVASSPFPFFISSWATNLTEIVQEGYPASPVITIYTGVQIAAPNLERVVLNAAIIYCNVKTKLVEARGTTIGAGNYDFWKCGTEVTGGAHVYATAEGSASIAAKANEAVPKQYWTKSIVFHGNDGNKVTWSDDDNAWVVSPDTEVTE